MVKKLRSKKRVCGTRPGIQLVQQSYSTHWPQEHPPIGGNDVEDDEGQPDAMFALDLANITDDFDDDQPFLHNDMDDLQDQEE